jgi:copper chaperone NosL
MKKIIIILIIGLFGITGCQSGPQPIEYGKAECAFCKMKIMDKRFGCQVINKHGKAYVFDDLSCMTSYLNSEIIAGQDVKGIYIPDYLGSNTLIEAEKLFYVAAEQFKSPMAGNVAGFSNKDSAEAFVNKLQGTMTTWDEISSHE